MNLPELQNFIVEQEKEALELSSETKADHLAQCVWWMEGISFKLNLREVNLEREEMN